MQRREVEKESGNKLKFKEHETENEGESIHRGEKR